MVLEFATAYSDDWRDFALGKRRDIFSKPTKRCGESVEGKS